MKKLFLTTIILAVSFIVAPRVEAGGASLYFSPNSGTFFIGSTFDVSVFINTGGNNINAVKVDLKFDPRKIQIASPTTGKSLISVWVAQPVYSNIQGTASFQGGMPSPGINTSSGLISTITFRAVAPGQTVISFSDSSKVLLDDGKGTNILSSSGRGEYSLAIPPPEGPKVFSSTHPDQNKWYNSNSPTLSWEKEEGVTGFSYILDQSFFGDVDNISEGSQTSISFADLEDGIWYFHIKAKKGNVWGGVSNYIMQIDKTPPASFQISVEPNLSASGIVSENSILTFVTTDNLSGISHYLLKLINLKQGKGEQGEGFFIEITSSYKLSRLEAGEYQIIVRAFDYAMNFMDSDKKIEVIPTEELFHVFRKGVNIFTLFIEWRKVILILIILIFIAAGIIYREIRYRRKIILAEKSFREAAEKLRKSNEEIRKEINGNK